MAMHASHAGNFVAAGTSEETPQKQTKLRYFNILKKGQDLKESQVTR
jgi:hypothetical protein